ncbi:hypothetical protein [Carnobacterium sp.]|uniref:hypothetical protein n=1 Tax=Carnobacterium sp. TaxID=48221 RepID=UPI0028B1C8CB|nr:hypothetical protein [Carnobacterium sp.]
MTCTGVGFSHDSLWDTMQHIDYIFTTHDVSIYSTCTITDKFAGRYPSDHFPVSAVCSLNEETID